MTSSAEIRRRPEKLSFSLTCSLLSQYIKEKGCPSDLGALGMASRSLDSAAMGKRETYSVPTTMSLLPGVEVSGDDQADIKDGISARNAARSMAPPADTKEAEKAQLTIFYSGKVLVFDNFPAEKAEGLMQLASKNAGMAAGAQSLSFMGSNSVAVVDRPSYPAPANSPASLPPESQPNFSDLPIARKASLHRFLEKRKDRISAKAPYQMGTSVGMKDVAALKEDINQPWLGLGSQISS